MSNTVFYNIPVYKQKIMTLTINMTRSHQEGLPDLKENSIFSDNDSDNDQPRFSYGHRFEYNHFRLDGRRNEYYVGCKWRMLYFIMLFFSLPCTNMNFMCT